ncbi:MAG: hypothetical protein A3A97_01145 [Candidatus Terrybacteria bacterium RIFCSPLOWO2_01_FULL_40_23]|uniref:Uncharacterized protein n=1 Tax=Candidatus Terrybacteria bacterium RIFCSPLOWO2_01_FULL_40_23 TaxID=1802366 RepID=A0A1G2PWN4_9BACT|nr:MAG: hypothetical protein A3A97_01145 [Candidatus Terrybacteria bacterium RIFCSPLOWO2_01_FULL_40_23]
MNKNRFILNLAFILGVTFMPASAAVVYAHGMVNDDAQHMMETGAAETSAALAEEEREGKEVWEKLQAKQVSCEQLTDEDFEVMGDYFMSLMVGSSHQLMDENMDSVIGEEGNEEMHIAMGKRLSGCDTSAAYPAGADGFMTTMMMGGGYMNNIMGYGYMNSGSAWFYSFAMLLMMIVWLVVGVLAAAWLWKQIKK